MEAADKNFAKSFHIVIDSKIWAALSPKAKAVYPVLLRHANYKTRVGRPTVPTIAKEAGLDKGSIYKANQELCKLGLMKMWKKDHRWYYYLFKEEDIHPEKIGIYPLSIGKHRKKSVEYLRDKETGRFILPHKSVIPQPKDAGMEDPESIGAKIETLNRENKIEILSDAEASACPESQASPSSNKRQKSLSQVSNETLFSLRDTFGGNEALKQYLLKNGYPKEEVEKLRI